MPTVADGPTTGVLVVGVAVIRNRDDRMMAIVATLAAGALIPALEGVAAGVAQEVVGLPLTVMAEEPALREASGEEPLYPSVEQREALPDGAPLPPSEVQRPVLPRRVAKKGHAMLVRLLAPGVVAGDQRRGARPRMVV